MEITKTRRENLRALAEIQGAANLAKALGYRQASFISQIAGPKPTRPLSEKNARDFEQKLGLPDGYLDRPLFGAAKPATVPEPVAAVDAAPVVGTGLSATVELLSDVIRMVGGVLEQAEVTLPPQRFAEMVALALMDATEHEGTPREAYAQQLVRLVK